MDINSLMKIFETFGLPIALIVVLIFIIYQMGKYQNEVAKENMKTIQDGCKKREDALMEEIKENRKINAKAIETIAHYSEKLDTIQTDIKEIKHDVSLIMVSENK